MLILALDSAGSACSVALWRDGAVLARRFAVMARGQSEVLVPMVGEVMAAAGTDFAALDLLAVSVGPGAFTGIRIGLATARALALAAGKPVAGIATTHAVAAAVPVDQRQGRDILVVVDSRRAELWVQRFDAQARPLGPILALAPEQVAAQMAGPLALAGDGAALVAALLPQAQVTETTHVDAALVAELAARNWPDRVLPAEPLYLRDADVTMSAAK
ncbi:tRNA (adenosine(37)-N6)-threonylcarbamoyltransferase complex dimerization subunit type 1 TsaB [Magnetospirillum sp. 64-120]|uniref:tRNA (adenosine(37)-N6)-threonylcarbamoyltransferase complex dimerization subunit type 1 TsaB n=1 Tax=Magnetospirillum sp. 64-120 TaxID=1895778 RepID=UPI000929D291|nr:tRNA (adenosine(37)-N6)-threonylcarbamoyltransferase complex dimerization subunit type 1 TsaB [Magnetospirillum sp. 64-120]OJX81939.1 MAG: tRNA (adenosine(37)-N6)-threonylcarbamoyltransferase complex dimerization subunit type 1 TsaB [Magnetospirillum sp. 64-120]